MSRMRHYLPYGGQGQQVPTARHLNCPTYLLPGGDNWPMLEQALREITVEEVCEGFVITIDDLEYSTPLTVLENTNPERVFWSVYRGHKGPNVDVSPFIDTREKWPETNSLTMYFDHGQLVQVVPGADEVPPLPWMQNAPSFPGGRDACIGYWRNHSLLYSRYNTLPLTRTHVPPKWWLDAA